MATGAFLSSFSSVHPRERSLRQVEKDLAPTVKEAGWVFFLEPVKLPARQQSLAEKRPGEGVHRSVIGVGQGFTGLSAGDQAKQGGLHGQGFGVEVGHMGEILILLGGEGVIGMNSLGERRAANTPRSQLPMAVTHR